MKAETTPEFNTAPATCPQTTAVMQANPDFVSCPQPTAPLQESQCFIDLMPFVHNQLPCSKTNPEFNRRCSVCPHPCLPVRQPQNLVGNPLSVRSQLFS